MNTHRQRLILPAVITALLLCLPLTSFSFQRTVNRSGAVGRSVSKNITSQRSDGGYTRSTTTTGPQGASINRSASGQWDSSSQTWTREVNRTGSSGTTSQHTAALTKTENGYAKEASISGPQGNSASKSVTGSWDAATNTWSKSVTTTGAGQ